MKCVRILRLFSIAIILSLLAVPVAGTSALARESIEVDPEEGEIGDRIQVTGDDFESDEDVYLYFSGQEAGRGDDIDDEVTAYYRKSDSTNEDGDLRRSFDVPTKLTRGDDAPEDVHGGEYYIYVTYYGSDDIEAVTEFTVITGEIELDTEEGVVGTEAEISGAYFAGREDIIVQYDDEEVDIESGDDDTDRHGEFECTILIPDSTAGEHTIAVEDESDHIAEALFTVESEMTIGATSGEVGDQVTVSGTGFKGDKEIVVTLGGIEVSTEPATIDTDDYGSFTGMFIVPDRDPATYKVEVSDGTNEESANFAVLVCLSMNISPTTGNVGTKITVTGTGFAASGTATIKYDDSVVTTTPVGSNKTLSATFDAPASEGGAHNIIVTDGTNTLTTTFTMESTAPSIPAPLKPEMGVKAESPVSFDWKDVEDPSGVAYTLQVATDEEFTTSSIVLEKKGLTKSEYTIAEKDKLESRKGEAPYYWRVKAIDAASNESDWSGAGPFHVGGFSFALTGWLIYVLFGVGALLLGILGFWLGKRSAYAYY